MSCQVCGRTTSLMSCGRCFKVSYCSKEHQVAHWKEHKPWCNSRPCAVPKSTLEKRQTTSSNELGIVSTKPTSIQSTTSEQVQFFNNNDSNQAAKQSTSAHVDPSILCSTSYLLKNVPLAQVGLTSQNMTPNANLDFSSQICPSMAGLKVCESSQLQDPMNSHANSQMNILNSIQLPSQIAKNSEAVFSNLNTYCQIILKDMNQYGFCVIDNFLQNGEAILGEVGHLYQRGLFRAGQVVNNRANSNSKLIRGDQIIWVEGNEPICNNIGFLVRILDSIVSKCNTTMAFGEFLKYNINRRTKAMIACYPGNHSKYVRHIDNPNSDGRCITSIYYLNKDYDRQKHGGVLRLFPQMNDGIVADIEPLFNRVIFFWSDRRNPHEVMPSFRMRFAITVWYFDANERANAIQKYKENSLQCPVDKALSPF